MDAIEAFLLVLVSNLLAAYQLNLFLLLLVELSYSRERLIYVMKRPRSRHQRAERWWDNFVNGVVPPEEWKENFRVSRATFLSLCEHVRPYIEHQTTVMRRPKVVERQVRSYHTVLSC